MAQHTQEESVEVIKVECYFNQGLPSQTLSLLQDSQQTVKYVVQGMFTQEEILWKMETHLLSSLEQK